MRHILARGFYVVADLGNALDELLFWVLGFLLSRVRVLSLHAAGRKQRARRIPCSRSRGSACRPSECPSARFLARRPPSLCAVVTKKKGLVSVCAQQVNMLSARSIIFLGKKVARVLPPPQAGID